MHFNNRAEVEEAVEKSVRDFQKRLTDFLDDEQLDFVVLGARSFRHPTKYYRWFGEDARTPSTEGLIELALTTGASLDWLLLGMGEPLIEPRPKPKKLGGQ